MNDQQRTVGTKEGLGVGIIGIGLLMAFLPNAAQQIADLDFIQSTAFGIMLGATYVLAVLVILAGLAVIFANLDDEVIEIEEVEEPVADHPGVLISNQEP